MLVNVFLFQSGLAISFQRYTHWTSLRWNIVCFRTEGSSPFHKENAVEIGEANQRSCMCTEGRGRRGWGDGERETPNNTIYDAFKWLVETGSVLGVHRKQVTGWKDGKEEPWGRHRPVFGSGGIPQDWWMGWTVFRTCGMPKLTGAPV